MSTYAALLRGINVSGRNKVGMADLGGLFVSLPADNVTTYVQSGNVVFRRSGRDNVDELRKTIEDRVSGTFGLSITVLLRSAEELRKVVRSNPLIGDGRDETKMHVTFLAELPEGSRGGGIDASAGGSDEFRVVGREVFLYCPGGYGTTKLNNAFFERKLATRATTRNWKTVNKLAHLSQEAEAEGAR